MFEKYLDDYYKSKIGVKEICKLVDSSPTTFRRWLKKNNLTPRQEYLKFIDTGIEGLNQTLRDRYSSIVNRCNGGTTDYYGHYAGKDYMPVYEWVDFCNKYKEQLREMWNVYLNYNKSSKYAISVDRINTENGYTKDNMQFVTHGFNSWRRTVNPIRVTHENKVSYFMSCEEASCFYGLRRQAIGECLSKKPYCIKGYDVTETTISDVLDSKSLNNLSEYYELLLLDENKKWDERKRWENNHR